MRANDRRLDTSRYRPAADLRVTVTVRNVCHLLVDHIICRPKEVLVFCWFSKMSSWSNNM